MKVAETDLSGALGAMRTLAPAGYALGFHIIYTTPRFMFQTYPRDWFDHYNRNGLIMSDPTIAWGFEKTGTCRWSEMSDPTGVLAQAAEFGLRYGLTCATDTGDSRSIGGYARSDREFEREEIEEISSLFNEVHTATHDASGLDAETAARLHKLSIMFTHPGSD